MEWKALQAECEENSRAIAALQIEGEVLVVAADQKNTKVQEQLWWLKIMNYSFTLAQESNERLEGRLEELKREAGEQWKSIQELAAQLDQLRVLVLERHRRDGQGSGLRPAAGHDRSLSSLFISTGLLDEPGMAQGSPVQRRAPDE